MEVYYVLCHEQRMMPQQHPIQWFNCTLPIKGCTILSKYLRALVLSVLLFKKMYLTETKKDQFGGSLREFLKKITYKKFSLNNYWNTTKNS